VNTLEDRLRAAAMAVAEAVPEGTAPALRLPARRSVIIQVLRRIRALLTPLGAATAVLGAVAVPLALPGVLQAASGATAIGPEGTPPYYVALAAGRKPGDSTYAVIGSTASGKTLAGVALPAPYASFTTVTGAADDRTFVLGARGAGRAAAEQLFLLDFDPARNSAQLSRLPILSRRGDAFDMLAVSPDGRQLAAADSALPREKITVYTLPTGASRTWTGESPTRPGLGYLSWSANGKWVQYGRESSGRRLYAGLLNPDSAGGRLPAELPVALPLPPPTPRLWPAQVTSVGMSADGDLLLARVAALSSVWYVTEYPIRGSQAHQLTSIAPAPASLGPDILWSSATGSTVIVASGAGQVGVMSNGLYSELPAAIMNSTVSAPAGIAWG
jgi:hypothetical protein